MAVVPTMFHYFPNTGYDEISDLAKEIYAKLPKQTRANHIHLASLYGVKVYGKAVLEYANENNLICSLRCHWLRYHYGNPFSSDLSIIKRTKDLVYVKDTETAVTAYIDWVLHSEHYRAAWIRDMCKGGTLKGKGILYYKELNQPSHANALDYLINEHNWIND